MTVVSQIFVFLYGNICFLCEKCLLHFKNGKISEKIRYIGLILTCMFFPHSIIILNKVVGSIQSPLKIVSGAPWLFSVILNSDFMLHTFSPHLYWTKSVVRQTNMSTKGKPFLASPNIIRKTVTSNVQTKSFSSFYLHFLKHFHNERN